VAAWHRRYNVSGTVHCDGRRLDDWCRVLRALLRTDDVGVMGYFTGQTGVFAFSSIADVVSAGSGVHEFHALVHGEPAGWSEFADALGSALSMESLPYSLVVHDAIQISP
jgi:hypothetical protein